MSEHSLDHGATAPDTPASSIEDYAANVTAEGMMATGARALGRVSDPTSSYAEVTSDDDDESALSIAGQVVLDRLEIQTKKISDLAVGLARVDDTMADTKAAVKVLADRVERDNKELMALIGKLSDNVIALRSQASQDSRSRLHVKHTKLDPVGELEVKIKPEKATKDQDDFVDRSPPPPAAVSPATPRFVSTEYTAPQQEVAGPSRERNPTRAATLRKGGKTDKGKSKESAVMEPSGAF